MFRVDGQCVPRSKLRPTRQNLCYLSPSALLSLSLSSPPRENSCLLCIGPRCGAFLQKREIVQRHNRNQHDLHQELHMIAHSCSDQLLSEVRIWTMLPVIVCSLVNMVSRLGASFTKDCRLPHAETCRTAKMLIARGYRRPFRGRQHRERASIGAPTSDSDGSRRTWLTLHKCHLGSRLVHINASAVRR